MKKIFTLLALYLTTVFAAKAGTKEIYTVFVETSDTGTLTYYCDENKNSHTSEGIVDTYDPVNEPDKVRFGGYNEKVTKAVIDPSMKDTMLTSLRNMFYGAGYSLKKLTRIEGLEYLNTSKVKDMNSMFSSCSALDSIQFGTSFNTGKVTSMAAMFAGCESLTSLDLSKFNTANVTDMSQMFKNCKALKTLNIRSFDVAKVVKISSMFYNCSELATIYCNNDWSQNTTATPFLMFKGCTSLEGGNGTTCDGTTNIELSYAYPDGVNGRPGYFTATTLVYTVFDGTETLTYYCGKDQCTHTEGPIEIYDPVNEPDKERFAGYDSYVKKAVIDKSMKDTMLTSMRRMFPLIYLTWIKGLENLNTSNVTDMSYMFAGCMSLVFLDLRSFNTSNVTDMNHMFMNCYELVLIQFGASFNTEKVTNMHRMFFQCEELSSLDLSSFNTSNVTDMGWMFHKCNSLASLDLSSFNTSNVTDMIGMFAYCDELTSLDISSFDVANVTNMTGMFGYCSKLATIYCNNDWSQNTTSTSSQIFYDCQKLVGGNGTTYESGNIGISYAHPDEGETNPGYFTKKIATGIESVQTSDVRSQKILHDGQIYIRYNGQLYNLQGARVK